MQNVIETGFPELTTEENREISFARENGFAQYFPASPDAKAQAQNTLRAARTFNDPRNRPGYPDRDQT